ncbi:MAG: hypothetical protein LBM77_00980 [Spirochaetaceae bacterium]|jgi:hypothetical protein|nr:hypothetical protein [Spirochaetaceae bacterium]
MVEYDYKCVPVPRSIMIGKAGKASHEAAVSVYERIIRDAAKGGWEFDRTDTVTSYQKAGCLAGLLGKSDEEVNYKLLIFRKKMEVKESSSVVSIDDIDNDEPKVASLDTSSVNKNGNNKTRLILERNTEFSSVILMEIYIDGKKVIELENNTTEETSIDNGTHIISAWLGNEYESEKKEFNANGNDIYLQFIPTNKGIKIN